MTNENGPNEPGSPTSTQLFGEACWLMSKSDAHKDLPIHIVSMLLLPAIELSQIRIFRNPAGEAIACVTWAFVSDEVNTRLRQGIRDLARPDWRCGSIFWIIDIVTPFGGRDEVLKLIHYMLPSDRPHPVLPIGGRDLADLVSELAGEELRKVGVTH